MKRLAAFTLAVLGLVLVGCTNEKAKPSAPSSTPLETKPNFVAPTAEEAYRLQDDCTRRGEKILQENVVGSALTQEQVSRYNAVTNRCYVRLEVHALRLDEWQKYDNSTYLKDGQTGELLAFFIVKPDGAKSFLGFDCSGRIPYDDGFSCVSAKVAACMNGKECAPQ